MVARVLFPVLTRGGTRLHPHRATIKAFLTSTQPLGNKRVESLFVRYEDSFSPLFVVVCEKRRKKEETLWLNNRRRDLALAFRTLLGEGATRPPTTYETTRGANDLPKITSIPSYKEKGRPEVNARLLVCAKG
jgi:hypothetical protein